MGTGGAIILEDGSTIHDGPTLEQSGMELVRRFVTIRAAHSNEEVDLEIPGNRPISELMPDLLKALGWPDSEGADPLVYVLRTESGHVLESADTFDSAGIENSDVLWIGVSEARGSSSVSEATQSPSSGPASSGEKVPGLTAVPASQGSPQERGAQLSPPIPASFRAEAPSLISDRGFVFELGSPPVLIGRTSRDSKPDIDLTEIDPEMASSRRHARILLREGSYLVEALPTTNGTFLNGHELQPGETRPLKSGDRLQLGIEGVELVFLVGGETIPASFFSPVQT